MKYLGSEIVKKKTLLYYNGHAVEYADSTINANMDNNYAPFLSRLKSKDRVLDLGCGSGRDSKHFLSLGFDVVSTDGSSEMCRYASTYLQKPVRCLLFEDLDYHNEFDAVWACATLLHVEKKDMKTILQKVANALKTNGVFYCSYKYGTEQREKEGRIFSDYTEADLRLLFDEDSDFVVEDYWISNDVRLDRSNEKWLNIICRKKNIR